MKEDIVITREAPMYLLIRVRNYTACVLPLKQETRTKRSYLLYDIQGNEQWISFYAFHTGQLLLR